MVKQRCGVRRISFGLSGGAGDPGRCASVVLLWLIGVYCLGCGGSSGPVSAPLPATPPFNTSLGEGSLVNSSTVQVYTTAALSAFYTQMICPANADQSICPTNEASLNTVQFGNFDLTADPIGKNSLGIQKVDAIKIDYTAINVDGTAVTVSGGIAMPEVDAASIKGMILYFHGTTTYRPNVPSSFAPISSSSAYTDGTLLAALWASQGYVVVMPDYIGLGDDTTHPHPYVVYPQVDAQSGFAMVKAARTLLAENYSLNANLPFFTTGYSEGGAYSLEAGHLMQDNPAYATTLNVTLRKVVPLSGFFDLSNTGLSYLFANVQGSGAPYYVYDTTTMTASKPYLIGYLASSYAHYASVPPTDILAAKYDPPCTPNCDTLYQLYFTSGDYDTEIILQSNNYAVQAGYLNQQSNTAMPLFTSAYATALMNHDTSNGLYQQVAAADTYTFTPQFPVTLVSLEMDSVVTRANSDVAYQYFIGKGTASMYQEVLIPNTSFRTQGYLYGYYNIDHTTEVPFLAVLMLNQFNQGLQPSA